MGDTAEYCTVPTLTKALIQSWEVVERGGGVSANFSVASHNARIFSKISSSSASDQAKKELPRLKVNKSGPSITYGPMPDL